VIYKIDTATQGSCLQVVLQHAVCIPLSEWSQTHKYAEVMRNPAFYINVLVETVKWTCIFIFTLNSAGLGEVREMLHASHYNIGEREYKRL